MAVIQTQDVCWQVQHKRSGRPIGLKNLGNTCYLNSILQCLTYTPPLANFCLRGSHQRQCEGDNIQCPFCLLESRVARSLQNDIALDSPFKIYKCLQKFATHFRPGRQEDAHELLRYAIDACDNVCIKQSRNGAKLVVNGDIPTVMKDIFGGYLDSQVQCMSCSTVSSKLESFMDLSLEIADVTTLKDALASFFQAETLEDSNRYNCEKCKTLTVARKQLFIHQAPNVLVFHFKRFDGMSLGKIDTHIEFKQKLSLASNMSKKSEDSYPTYSLYATVVHSGCSQYSGHYYAYVKDRRGQWYCCNDGCISEADANEVLGEKVYILFYVRDCPRPSLAEENPSSASSTPSPPPTPDPETSTTPASMPARQSPAMPAEKLPPHFDTDMGAKIWTSNGTRDQVKFSITKPSGKRFKPNVLAARPTTSASSKPIANPEQEADTACIENEGKATSPQKRTRETIESQSKAFNDSAECEELKARLMVECREALLKSDWIEDVREELRDVKRRRSLSPDDPDSKEQLISECRDKLLRALPGFVKEELVEELRPIVEQIV